MPSLEDVPSVALHVELLGSGRVLVGGADVGRWRSRKALEVLRFLGSRGAAGVRREEVIEQVWPSRDPAKGRTLLRTALAEIRRTLEPDRDAGETSRFLHASRDRLWLEATTDLAHAKALADSGDHIGAFGALKPGAADLDGEGDWTIELQREIDQMRVTAAERVVAAGGPERIPALELLIEAEPWQRRWYDQLSALHREGGDEAAANEVDRLWFASDS